MRSENEITVTVVKFSSKPFFLLRAFNPATGKTTHRSSKTTKKNEANKLAGVWEEELRSGIIQASKATWQQFRERYEDEVLPTLAPATDKRVQGVFNKVEKFLSPRLLKDVDANRISYLQSKLLEAGASLATVKTHSAHLKAALRWAVKIGWLPKAPAITMPKRAKGAKAMKGRPITGEEFDRMLAKVAAVVGDAAAPSWKHYLNGLWLSGLRLAESLELTWDDETKLCVDLQPGEHPMLRIPAGLEKGNQDRLLPMAPEFAEFIQQTPEANRTGYVFDPMAQRKRAARLGDLQVSRVVGLIGEKAGVKVNTKPGKDGQPVVKYASAHDLRRSFGLRWASRVMPQVLMVLMRHDSIETTMRYYVGRNAQSTAAVLWQAHAAATAGKPGNLESSNGFGNGATFGGQPTESENVEKHGVN